MTVPGTQLALRVRPCWPRSSSGTDAAGTGLVEVQQIAVSHATTVLGHCRRGRDCSIDPRMRASLLQVGLALSLVAVAGCSDDSNQAAGGGGGSNVPSDVSFHEHVEPLLQRSCLSCHMPGLIGGFSLEKYEEAKPLAGMIAKKTAAREMPPFLAQDTDDCQVVRGFVDDIRLSDDEIAMLQAWADAGAPQGDPAKAPPASMGLSRGRCSRF